MIHLHNRLIFILKDTLRYQFASVEVKQLAFRIDGVFLPAVDIPKKPVYFLEVQFQADGKFYSRFFSEIFFYLDKTELNNNWRAVVIFPSRKVDTSNTERYTELLESRRVTRIYLDLREIETMFSLSDLKNTKVYQEALEEGELQGKLATVPFILSLGATVEQIAEALGLDVEQVQQVAQLQVDRDRNS